MGNGNNMWVGFSILSCILLASILIQPFQDESFTICLFKNITGIPCPGCGMTRAFLFLGHGKIHEATMLNPNSLLAFTIIIFLWINKAVYIATGKEVRVYLTRREKILAYLLSGLSMLAVWVYNFLLNPYL